MIGWMFGNIIHFMGPERALWMKERSRVFWNKIVIIGKFYCIQYVTWSKVKIIAVSIIKPYPLTESIKTQKIDVLYIEHGDLRNGWKIFE